jgi:3-oxoacyl-[acyl-carrier-protein] synthase II
MKARIQGIGVVGSFGSGRASLAGALSRPEAGVPGAAAGGPAPGADTSALAQVIPAKSLRRVDHYSRMALLAGHLAMADAGIAGAPAADLGVIVATGMGPTAGFLDTQSPDAGAEELRLSPILFSNSVHNAAAAHLSMLLKIRGPNLSINHYDLSFPLAILTALDWIEEGRVAAVLVGGVDVRPGEAPAGSPNEVRRSPAAGEGSAFFVLTRPASGASRYPLIREVHISGNGPPEPRGPALYLHGGSGAEAGLPVPGHPQAVFGHLYGAFPTDMALDLAAAALLLENRAMAESLPAPGGGGAGFRDFTCIRCLKKSVTGACAMIELGA